MIDSLQSVLQPVIVDLLMFVILALAGWVMSKLPEKWRVEIEAKHREALHKALDTGIGLLIDTAQKHPAVAGPDMALDTVLDYVERSVPDAIKRLGPSRKQLEDMARAKLQQRVDAVMGRDRLAEALKQAGAV